ncbi:MAG: deoxyguanosinetriphosphate triphosphohydrolase [Mariprofundaceae bacterium]
MTAGGIRFRPRDYDDGLAPWACKAAFSRGRDHPEAESVHRNPYQRDRDRIIHSTAFRRLEYKTQVFVNHEGDHYRTRLTHSVEVAQIARSICRVLGLHEDLAEAIALAHDLGHTPFGHSGQDALDAVMRPYGGFEHNRQSLRVVEKLERRYAAFPGLNLSYETREGIVKHHSPYDIPKNRDLARFHLDEQAPLEAQVSNLADEIAYTNHDVDDGYRAGMLGLDDLMEVAVFRMHFEQAEQDCKGAPERILVHETVRRMINFMVLDVVEETLRRLTEAGVDGFAAVRAARSPLVGFSREVRHLNGELKRFLYRRMYRHHRVVRMAAKAQRVIREMFAAYMETPEMLPDGPRNRALEAADEAVRARVIADYIAGMTDRYALDEYARLFDVAARA